MSMKNNGRFTLTEDEKTGSDIKIPRGFREFRELPEPQSLAEKRSQVMYAVGEILGIHGLCLIKESALLHYVMDSRTTKGRLPREYNKVTGELFGGKADVHRIILDKKALAHEVKKNYGFKIWVKEKHDKNVPGYRHTIYTVYEQGPVGEQYTETELGTIDVRQSGVRKIRDDSEYFNMASESITLRGYDNRDLRVWNLDTVLYWLFTRLSKDNIEYHLDWLFDLGYLLENVEFYQSVASSFISMLREGKLKIPRIFMTGCDEIINANGTYQILCNQGKAKLVNNLVDAVDRVVLQEQTTQESNGWHIPKTMQTERVKRLAELWERQGYGEFGYHFGVLLETVRDFIAGAFLFGYDLEKFEHGLGRDGNDVKEMAWRVCGTPAWVITKPRNYMDFMMEE